MKVSYLIIGCGPTGLGAAYRLKDLGVSDYLIVDQASHTGGLATSFKDAAGFWWDIGGHVQFSHYKYFDDAMIAALPPDQWLEHQRESWVWIKERFVPYPFQNNIRYLPRETLFKCLQGLLHAWKENSNARPDNFHEWIVQAFGQGVADEFMLPYNYKVWAYPPAEMAYQWIGERVAIVDFERILENIVHERMDASWGPNNTFKFPLRGGTGAIWESMTKLVGLDKVRLNSRVISIDAKMKQAFLENGEVIEYGTVLSTIPVDKVTEIVKQAPSELRRTASLLKHSASNIVGIGLRGRPSQTIGSKCWMYFPENNCPFYRVTVFSNYSPNNVPDVEKYYSLMTETSESSSKIIDHGTLIEDTIAGLRATKLINDSDEIVSRWVYRAEYGYPTPSLERDAILDIVIPALDDYEVYSRGRFGGWKYEVSNQDHSFMQGVEWTDWQVNGVPEKTYTVSRNFEKAEYGEILEPAT